MYVYMIVNGDGYFYESHSYFDQTQYNGQIFKNRAKAEKKLRDEIAYVEEQLASRAGEDAESPRWDGLRARLREWKSAKVVTYKLQMV